MSRIAFVGCVKDKHPGPLPAADKYASPLFLASKRYALREADRWYILSAKYGLLCPDDIVDDYDLTLKTMAREECRQWARRVAAQLDERNVTSTGDTIVWLTGLDYSRDLVPLMPQQRHSFPLQGLKLGPRLQWLNRANHDATPNVRTV